MSLATAPTQPTHLTCSCGMNMDIASKIPRRRKGSLNPTCSNCGVTLGKTIEFERANGDMTYRVVEQGLEPPERRVDMTKVGADLSPLESYFAARYPALLIETQEPERTIQEVLIQCQRSDKSLWVWDCVAGLRCHTDPSRPAQESMVDPAGVLDESAKLPENSVLVLKNYHHFLGKIPVIQRIENYVALWKKRQITIITLAPVIQLPLEVERLFTVFEARLPNPEEVMVLIEQAYKDHKMQPDDRDTLLALQRAATGLTSYEIENALRLSILKAGRLDPKVVAHEKGQLIRKHGGLELALFDEDFSTLGGAKNLKAWTLKHFAAHQERPDLPSRGILLVGPPGTGKSHFAKALGNEIGLPTLTMDFGRMFTGEAGREGIVGSAEAMIRRSLRIADAMAPVVLMIDEIDKGLSGVSSSGQTDGGTGSRVFGSFLSWLQDHKSDVFVIASANNISAIPPEFFRPGRWDGIFFVDLPDEEERAKILDYYGKVYRVEIPSTIESDVTLDGWSGAELRQLCIEAAKYHGNFGEAADNVIPLSYSAKEYIDKIRAWAETRCLHASRPRRPRPVKEGNNHNLPVGQYL